MDFERGQVSYADVIGITVLPGGRNCERFSRHFRYGLSSARRSCAERREKNGGLFHRVAGQLKN
jgi:hypothetical protein